MNIKDIIASTRDYNLHSHTQFCDGRQPMAVMAEAALKCGMKHYGFSPHSPIIVPSTCNMAKEDVDEYFAEFHRLKELYRGRMELCVSMEIDYLGPKWGASNEYFQSLPLDYRLSSIHFIPSLVNPDEEVDVDGRPAHFAGKMTEHFDGDIRYVVDTFYARTLEMIERGGFDMMGHFDKIGFNASSYCPGIEEQPWYKTHIDNVIDAIRATDIVVEVNTKAWLPNVGCTPEEEAAHQPRLFPSPQVIKRLVSAGVPLAVNSDAHYPQRITAGRAEAYAIIDSVASAL